MKRFMNKKVAVVGVAVALAIAAGGAAFAYFTTTGSGTGSAAVATNAPLVINQTGLTLYNSTIGLTSYVQDQCLQCVQASDFGNTVKLVGPVLSNDLNVVVAMRSWDAAAGTWPITLTIDNPGPDVSGSSPGSKIVSDTQYFTIPAANPNGRPTPFNITFDQFPHWKSIPSEVAYDISFPTTNYPGAPSGFSAAPTGFANGLNIALSSSSSDISVGSDPYLGTVLINTSDNGGFTVDAGTCIDPTLNTFSLSNVWCGDTPGIGNYGAYGNSAGADIPAVEFINTASGLAGLYPGGPSQTIDFTVYNPGVTTEALNSVTIALATDPANGEIEAVPGDTSTDVAGCYASWFSTTPQTWSGGSIASEQTVDGSGTVSMPASTSNQDPCQGATPGLVFSAS